MMYLASGDIERVGYLNASCQQCTWSISKKSYRWARPGRCNLPLPNWHFNTKSVISANISSQTVHEDKLVRRECPGLHSKGMSARMMRKSYVLGCASCRKAPCCFGSSVSRVSNQHRDRVGQYCLQETQKVHQTYDKWFHEHSAFTVQSKFGKDIAALDLSSAEFHYCASGL